MHAIEQLTALMAKLRDPDTGCPWDLKQNFASLVPYTLEEAYEVAETIEQEDYAELKDELGDLLFQVVFYAQLASEQGLFDFSDVATAITNKMVRRHPHVFGDTEYADETSFKKAWTEHKRQERLEKGQAENEDESVLAGVTQHLPSLVRAQKLQKRAAQVGFDWPEVAPVLDKVEEEIHELRETLPSMDKERQAEELGDLMFSCVNLARKLSLDAETVLRQANRKFESRFRGVENHFKVQQSAMEEASLDEMEAAWQQVKQQQK